MARPQALNIATTRADLDRTPNSTTTAESVPISGSR
jgi:hypothetical protein